MGIFLWWCTTLSIFFTSADSSIHFPHLPWSLLWLFIVIHSNKNGHHFNVRWFNYVLGSLMSSGAALFLLQWAILVCKFYLSLAIWSTVKHILMDSTWAKALTCSFQISEEKGHRLQWDRKANWESVNRCRSNDSESRLKKKKKK